MTVDYFYGELAKRLIRARELGAQSQKKAAEFLGVDRTTLSKWEHGHTQPSIQQLFMLADFYSVSVEWLAFGLGQHQRFVVYDDERRFIEKFRSLSPIQQNAFLELFSAV